MPITNIHPVVQLLASNHDHDFHLVGSRAYKRTEVLSQYPDWDFLVDGSGKNSSVENWLTVNHFKVVETSGYGDPHSRHYRWNGGNSVGSVDVVVITTPGVFQKRVDILDHIYPRYPMIVEKFGKSQQAWKEFFRLMERYPLPAQ